MTNAQLVEKLQSLDPTAQATLTVKDHTGQSTILPVLWIAKGSIYSKVEKKQDAELEHLNQMYGGKPF